MNKTECTKLLGLINEGRINDLKELLEANLYELRMKELNGNGYMKAVKKVTKLIEKAGKRREVLGFYDVQDGQQVFTDSYIGFRMNEGHYIETIKHHENNHGVYPDCRDFFPVANPDCMVEIDMDQLAKPYKIVPMNGKDMALYEIKSEYNMCKAVIQAEFLEIALGILGNNTKMYVFGSMRPVLLESEKGTCIIVPVRMD